MPTNFRQTHNGSEGRLAQFWHFDPNSVALVFRSDDGQIYHSIDLRKITSSACMLDAIFDTSGRHWASKEITGDLVQALQELFDPQITLCGAGRDDTLDPVAHLEKRRIQ